MTDTTTLANTREWEGITIPTPGTFTLDPAHTSVGFVAKHMMVTKVRGHFPEVEGTIALADDLTQSTIDVTLQDGIGQHRSVRPRQAPSVRGLLRRRDLPGDHLPIHLNPPPRWGGVRGHG